MNIYLYGCSTLLALGWGQSLALLSLYGML